MTTKFYLILLNILFCILRTTEVCAKNNGVKIQVKISKNSERENECKEFKKSIITAIKAKDRFSIETKSNASLTLEFSCTSELISGKISFAPLAGEPFTVTSHAVPIAGNLNDDPNIVVDFLDALLDGLPWAGEVTHIIKARLPKDDEIKDIPGYRLQARATITLGFYSNTLLGRCIPLDFGVPELNEGETAARFRVLGTVLISQIESVKSQGDVYPSVKNLDLRQQFVVRLADPEKLSEGTIEIIRNCHARIARVESEKDPIEINEIQQRFGIAAGKLTSSNGVSSPLIGSGYIHNRLLFGSYLLMDGFVSHAVYTKAYRPLIQGTAGAVIESPDITDAQFFAGTRFKIERLSALLGVGVIIEKYNIPFLSDVDGSIRVRESATRLGFLFGANYGFKRLSFGLRLPYSQWNGRRYADLHFYTMYRMSKTWTIGMDLITKTADSVVSDVPSIRYSGVGLFLGIQLGR